MKAGEWAAGQRPATLPHAHRVAPEAGSPLTGTRRNMRSQTTALLPAFACATAKTHMGRGVLDLGSELVATRGGCWKLGSGRDPRGGFSTPPLDLGSFKSANRNTRGGVLQHDAHISAGAAKLATPPELTNPANTFNLPDAVFDDVVCRCIPVPTLAPLAVPNVRSVGADRYKRVIRCSVVLAVSVCRAFATLRDIYMPLLRFLVQLSRKP